MKIEDELSLIALDLAETFYIPIFNWMNTEHWTLNIKRKTIVWKIVFHAHNQQHNHQYGAIFANAYRKLFRKTFIYTLHNTYEAKQALQSIHRGVYICDKKATLFLWQHSHYSTYYVEITKSLSFLELVMADLEFGI